MKLLDLFCGAGGAAAGYNRAGFDDILGVDIKPQPRYPFAFVQADALDWLKHNDTAPFDLIHASPPCQRYTAMKALASREHPDLIAATRHALRQAGKPYVIENVPGAPLHNPVTLCGTMFGLQVIRHRLFETWPHPIYFPPRPCQHEGKATSANADARKPGQGTPAFRHGYRYITVVGHSYIFSEGKQAMGIDWMNRAELSQAIPPAYTEWLGTQLKPLITQTTSHPEHRTEEPCPNTLPTC